MSPNKFIMKIYDEFIMKILFNIYLSNFKVFDPSKCNMCTYFLGFDK
jgi:hypothetical protein